MNMQIKEINGVKIAMVNSKEKLIFDTQSALDFMVNVQYETGSSHVTINQGAISEDFFVLSSRLAGDILQKFTNYNVKLAIIGDFSKYTSKPLKDFIYESNKGKNVFFYSSENEAIEKLSCV